jgi:hypothetical protein
MVARVEYDPRFRGMLDALRGGSTFDTAVGTVGLGRGVWYRWVAACRAGEPPSLEIGALVTDAHAEYARATAALMATVTAAGESDWRASAWAIDHRVTDRRRKADARRAKWEAEIAEHRAKGDHIERHEVTGSTAADEIRRRVARLTESAAAGGGAVGPDGGGGDGALDGVAVLGATGSTPARR